MKKTTLYVTLILLIFGCANKPNWVQEGKRRQDTKYDRIQCYDYELKQHAGFEDFTDQEIKQHMSECMKAKGYRDETQTQK